MFLERLNDGFNCWGETLSRGSFVVQIRRFYTFDICGCDDDDVCLYQRRRVIVSSLDTSFHSSSCFIKIVYLTMAKRENEKSRVVLHHYLYLLTRRFMAPESGDNRDIYYNTNRERRILQLAQQGKLDAKKLAKKLPEETLQGLRNGTIDPNQLAFSTIESFAETNRTVYMSSDEPVPYP
jgi:hypothetical protein